jgi:hypothetical protein
MVRPAVAAERQQTTGSGERATHRHCSGTAAATATAVARHVVCGSDSDFAMGLHSRLPASSAIAFARLIRTAETGCQCRVVI